MAADRATMKGHIAKIIEGVPNLEELSAKQVREQLEQKLGLEQGSLKSEKATISEIIDEVLDELPHLQARGARHLGEVLHIRPRARVLAHAEAAAPQSRPIRRVEQIADGLAMDLEI